ncbi:uncharacterized protein RSE6_12267 [Rhynchosporium secalis]|uniref:GP-PDE domain-containing protein n=1 Tax=Rhynchosporium secalis TaxID=38038 RepID=A0A1E1MPZ5_RHYSE|nr:uncharacterized protein RSE6_12267 [Rhynchosporium secalis]
MNRIYGKLIRCSGKSSELGTCQSVIRGQLEVSRGAYVECADQLNRIQSNRANSKDKLASPIVAHRLDQDHQAVAAIISENHLVMQTGCNRNLLEFGATHGMINLCTQVLSGVTSVKDHVLLKNEAGLTSVHIAVVNGYVEIARLLLSIIDNPFVGNPDNLLHIALRNQDDAMVELLVSRSIGLRHTSSSAETCIYIAAQLGRQDYLCLLLPVVGYDFIDAAESACHWTPLFVSCVEGHAPTVRLLIDAGADTDSFDYLGWTAKEHAVFRGHLAVGEMFSSTDKTPKPSISTIINGRKGIYAPRHDVSSGFSHLTINLGSLQENGKSKLRTMNLLSLLEHGLMLTVSTSESAVSVQRMLPILDDSVDDTFVFFVINSEDITVLFNIHEGRADPDGQGTLIGAGIALLEAHNNCVGIQHGLLMREQSVAIMYKGILKLLGTISFSYTIIKPYHQLQSPKYNSKSLRTTGSAKIVGHRGLGQNCQDNFFDSQPSTLEPTSMLGGVGNYEARDNVQVVRVRSGSVAFADERETERMKNRMKHTVDYQDKGIKPNTRGDVVHGTFATLQDTLGKLPEHIGVDMEINVIARFGKGRHVILSSFTPDICILLAIKQNSYPVAFITNAGLLPTSDKDIRAGSLQNATRFARQWGLAGVVAAADSLVMCPRLINYIKSHGLVCGTYNALNHEPINIEVQVRAGIDLIVTDRVKVVSRILKTIHVD